MGLVNSYLIYFILSLVLIIIICIHIHKLRVKDKMVKKPKKEYYISSATLKDGTCKLLETKKGKFAVCREKDKIKVFEIDESED